MCLGEIVSFYGNVCRYKIFDIGTYLNKVVIMSYVYFYYYLILIPTYLDLEISHPIF